MNVYTTDRIRNVVLLGHGGCGKTSLVEAMAYLAGLTTRMGTVADKNTISDFDKEETKRQFSIHTSVVAIPWKDNKINVLDTPGYFDFVGEVEEAVSAADAAIIVISGKAGIETGTRRAWEICEKNHLPRMIFVTDMDIDNASYRQVVEDLQALYGKKIAPFHLPVREDGQFVGYVNVIQQKAKRWIDEGTVEKFEVPEYSQKNLNLCREALLEAVAETSEEFMDRYFNGDEFSEDEIRQALRVNVMDGSIVPVLMGSNPLARGMYTLMADIVKYFPSPDKRTCAGINTTNNEVYPADYDFAKPKSAYIFKTIVDPYIGKYSLIKVNSGVLKTDDVLFNYHRDCDEKIGKLYVLRGNKTEEVKELHAGDIGALAKLSLSQTTDSLSVRNNPVAYLRTNFSKPYVSMRYKAKNKGDVDKISQSLQKILMEDQTLRVVNDSENRPSLLYGTKSYGFGESKADILKGIDLQISDGDFAVILGASGSGKSTLLNCLSGLERVDGGSIEYDGLNIAELSDKALTKFRKENIGFIFQQYYLLPDMTVDKNVRMGADLAGNTDYREIIKAVGLEAKAAKYPSELSGGEQQRVSVARALAKKPKVLFLDEPTGALDEKTGRQVLDYICKLHTEYGFTIVMVTHNANIAEMANTVIRMNSGEIAEIYVNTVQKSAYEIGW